MVLGKNKIKMMKAKKSTVDFYKNESLKANQVVFYAKNVHFLVISSTLLHL